MMNRISMVASVALAMAMAACGGKATDSPAQPSVAEARQETRGTAEKVEHTGECARERAKDPAMAEAKDLLGEEKYGEAAARFEAIAAAHPENAKAVLLQGYSLHAAGRLDEALAVHMRAAEFADVKAVALYNAACVHALKGETDKAFAVLDQSIKAGFSGAEHMKKDEDLKSLQSDPRFASALQAAAANPKDEKMKAEGKGEMCKHPSHQKHAKK
jgi:Flp pilus assembly protein TadD